MLFFIFFGRCPKNCSIAPRKIILPDSGGGGCTQPLPSAHTPMRVARSVCGSRASRPANEHGSQLIAAAAAAAAAAALLMRERR